jgi:hypothetical protein
MHLTGKANMEWWWAPLIQASLLILFKLYMQLKLTDYECNLGHDVAEDMVNAGLASVTMIQRSKTCMA